jgi:hypothetical protein
MFHFMHRQSVIYSYDVFYITHIYKEFAYLIINQLRAQKHRKMQHKKKRPIKKRPRKGRLGVQGCHRMKSPMYGRCYCQIRQSWRILRYSGTIICRPLCKHSACYLSLKEVELYLLFQKFRSKTCVCEIFVVPLHAKLVYYAHTRTRKYYFVVASAVYQHSGLCAVEGREPKTDKTAPDPTKPHPSHGDDGQGTRANGRWTRDYGQRGGES